jgi:hypothetical protein
MGFKASKAAAPEVVMGPAAALAARMSVASRPTLASSASPSR